MITCRFYVKDCIFVHMTDKIFLVIDPFMDRWPLKVEMLKPPPTGP